MRRRDVAILSLLALAALFVASCAGAEGPQGPAGAQGPPGPAGPQGPAGEVAEITPADLPCTECHNDTALIEAKHTAWAESRHGSGEAYVRGTRNSCAGCHSGAAFSEMIAAGGNPGAVESGDPDPTRQTCRTCHQIHVTYTGEDWALTITDAVDFYAIQGATYDGGQGNLCVNCHQPRRDFPAAENGVISGISTHWGPHHGPQSSMLLGVGGGGAEGGPSPHYAIVDDTCVGCHMGEADSHTFEPTIDACQACHSGAENFDINGVQSEIQAMADELGELLLAAGLIDENSPDGHPIVSEAPEGQALALWNWLYVAHEDQSLGVHNPAYTRALLEAALEAMR